MEKFDNVYDSLTGVYSAIEYMMGEVYEELQQDPDNMDKSNFLQGLGSVALKVINSQQQLVESYAPIELKETFLSKLDEKQLILSNSLEQDKNRTI